MAGTGEARGGARRRRAAPCVAALLAASLAAAWWALPALAALRRGPLPVSAVSLKSARIEVAPYPPVELSAELEERDGRVRFHGRAAAEGPPLALDFEGSHVLADAAGEAHVRLEPLVFRRGGLQPAQLLPSAADLTGVAGELQIEARPRWSPDAIDTPFDVSLRSLSFDVGGLHFQGVDARLRFESALPPVTAPGQRVVVAGLGEKGALGRAELVFQIRDATHVAIEALVLSAPWGSLRTRGLIDLEAKRPQLVWQLEADLAQLLRLLDFDGLSGSGRLVGEIPVEIGDAGAAIRDGSLAASGGQLQLRRDSSLSAGLPDVSQIELVRSILEDFHYQTLDAALDGSFDGMTLRLRLAGSNPNVHGAHPIEYNLQIDGISIRLLESVMSITELPIAIAESIAARASR